MAFTCGSTVTRAAAILHSLDLGLQWASHVVGCGWPGPGLRARGGTGGWGGGGIGRGAGWVNGLKWGWWSSGGGGGGGLMAARPLCHMATSQVQGEVCWPPTGRRENNNVGINAPFVRVHLAFTFLFLKSVLPPPFIILFNSLRPIPASWAVDHEEACEKYKVVLEHLRLLG